MAEKRKFFIGSSIEAEPLVNALVRECKARKNFPLEPLPWRKPFEDAKRRKTSFLEVILNEAVDCAFAVFFWTDDDVRVSKRAYSPKHPRAGDIPRDNVILETGIFLGALGRNRVLIGIDVQQEKGMLLPSDFVADIQCRERFFDERRRVVGKAIKNLADTLEKSWKENRFLLEPGASRVYTTREDCYLAGIELTRKASMRVASILSYKDEVAEDGKEVWSYPGTLENRLYKVIRHKMRDDGVMVYRWCNLAVESIKRQAMALVKLVGAEALESRVKIRNTNCKYIEVLIADDEVLIVLPRGRAKGRPEVATGVHINNRNAARLFFDWFLNHVPDPKDLSGQDFAKGPRQVSASRRILKKK